MSSEETRKNHLCIACGQSIDPRDLASMQCGHPFHYQCLQISLGNQINKKEYPLCCPIPQCFVEPSMYFMSVVLEEPAFQDYLQLEKNSVQAFETYECPSCDQSFLAFQSNKTHKCLKCYKVICLDCQQLAHPNKPCSLNDHGKKMKQQLAQQVVQQQQQQQQTQASTARNPPPPKVISQPQNQQDSSHSRKHSQTQLQQPQPSQFSSAQLIQPLNSFFQKNQIQQQQEQQYNPQQQKQQYSTLQIQSQKQQQQHILKEYQQQQQSAQTTRKSSPRRNSIVSSNEDPKNIPLRQLSLKKNDSMSGDHPSLAVHHKELEEFRSNNVAQAPMGTIVKKQPQIGIQQIQRKFSSTVAPSPTSAQFTHKKNSLSQVPGSYDYSNFVGSPNKESNFSIAAANQSSIVSVSTAPMNNNTNKSAKTSRKSFDRGDAPFLQGTSDDINKILCQTAALMKLQPNALLARKNVC